MSRRLALRRTLGLAIGDAPALAARFGPQGQPSALLLQPGSAITASDVDALAAFLESLTSPRFVPASGSRRAAEP